MTKLANLSTFRQAYNSFHTLLFYNRNIRKAIRTQTQQYNSLYIRSLNQRAPQATKIGFQQFKDSSCLSRWGEVSDREFGGSSKAELIYNDALRCLVLKGIVNTKDKQKLRTYPFIGIIQKQPFLFRTGIFNSIRVQIIGDGQPMHCQIQVFCPIEGKKLAHGFLLSQKEQNWVTYELPFRNFQLKGQEARNKIELYDKDRKTMNSLIDSYPKTDLMQITKISFRLLSKTTSERLTYFRKIELVRTIRGERQSFKYYTKPYFYIIDENQEKDKILKKINVGDFVFTNQK